MVKATSAARGGCTTAATAAGRLGPGATFVWLLAPLLGALLGACANPTAAPVQSATTSTATNQVRKAASPGPSKAAQRMQTVPLQATTNRPPGRVTVITPLSNPTGRVVSLNTQARFVVVDFLFQPLPSSGQKLSVYRDGKKVGVVRCSPFASGGQVAADIIEGDPRPGDEARSQ